MLFQTPSFAAFLLVTVALVAAFPGSEARKRVLVAASYLFYMRFTPWFVAPLLVTTFLDYAVGAALEREPVPGRRRALLVLSLTANLGLLAYFKYAGFFASNVSELLRALGLHASLPLLHVALPVGISFYTFHSMSYTIDVYRGRIPACRSPLDFALFVTFFPLLVAGPIVRARHLLPQLARPIRFAADRAVLLLVVRGLAKKVLIADRVAPFADEVFGDPASWPSLVIWLATVAFSVQIYCDFSGYSDIAIGLARFFGLSLPPNFDRPYFAANPQELWRRWHISLSSWLRDYLYVPLGGSRHGTVRTLRNMLITMLLGGLWHGASWNFVLWGLFHGVLLAGHRLYRSWRPLPPGRAGLPTRLAALGATQLCVLVSWLIFRVQDSGALAVALRKALVFDLDLDLAGRGLLAMGAVTTVATIGVFYVLHAVSRARGGLDERLAAAPLPLALAAFVGIGACFFALWPMAVKPFIYFQF